MSLNLIMIDHASKDDRSVKAMLLGNGDGRENIWLKFEKSEPELPQEVLMERFKIENRFTQYSSINRYSNGSIWKYISALILFTIFVA